MKMIAGFLWEVGLDILHKRLLQTHLRFVTERLRKRLQNGQIGGALQVQDPARLLCLVVLVESDVPERLEHLRTPVIDSVRGADECDDYVPIGSLGKHNLRMAG